MSEKFKQISPSEFFYQNRDMAGFGNPTQAIYTGMREFFENGLDACDSARIPADIYFGIEGEGKDPTDYTITVRDNGPGLPPDVIPEVFGSIMYGSKFGLKQARGMFGMGATMAILYGQITSRVPFVVSSGTGKRWTAYVMTLDIKHNKPIIKQKYTDRREHSGTEIRCTLRGNYSLAAAQIHRYIEYNGIITPYANITYSGPRGENINIRRVTDVVPEPPRNTTPHPRGTDAETITRLIQETVHEKYNGEDVRSLDLPNRILYTDVQHNLKAAEVKKIAQHSPRLVKFLSTFDTVGHKTAQSFCSYVGIPPETPIWLLSDNDIVLLADAMASYGKWSKPTSSVLAPLGACLLQKGMETIFEPDFIHTIQRRPFAYGGWPCIIEMGMAYGGSIKQPGVYRFANRIPLLYGEKGDALYHTIHNKALWKRYGLNIEEDPVAICVHICSTRVPYKSVGKESVADRPEITREVQMGVWELGKKIKTYIHAKHAERRSRERQEALRKYLVIGTERAAAICNVEMPSVEAVL